MTQYNCNNCGNKYQAENPLTHRVLGVVCASCFIGNENLTDSAWA